MGIGICVVANILTDFLSRGIERVERKWRDNLRAAEAAMDGEVHDKEEAARKYGHWNGFLFALGAYFFFIGIGVWFYRHYESCVCSYGETKKEGCIPGDQC